jgi:hypothetical protein
MAIHDENQSSQAANATGFGLTSFHTGALFAAPISRGLGSEVFTKVKTALAESYKEANNDFQVALLDLDNVNNPTFDFSSLVVALKLRNGNNNTVTFHILLLEATGELLVPTTENIQGRTVEIHRATSEAVDGTLIKAAAEKVEKAFPGCTSVYVDATVIPNTFNADDKVAMHKLALNAGLAGATELMIRQEGFRDLNLANLPQEGTLVTNLQFGRTQIENAVGQPVRSDVVVSFSSRKNTTGSRPTVNSGDKEVNVSRASGFIDLVWAPRGGDQGFNPWFAQQQPQQPMNAMMTQKYASRLVLTDLQSNYAYSPAVVLLAVATALTAGDNTNWAQTFRPTPGNGKFVDLNDIGALNIEANLFNETDKGGFGSRIKTKGEDFKLTELGQMINALVQPGMMLAIDCPEAGPQSWYLSVFAAAAAGRQAAYEEIYSAANDLTNGRFGQHFPAGTNMFVDTGNRVHLGHWTDRSGSKRDIRDFDHLAVCNLLGESNPAAIRDWSDTWLRTEYPLAQRLEARRRIINSMSQESAVYTGYASRVTFSKQFLAALSAGIRETGVAVRVQTPLSASDLNNMRGVASWADQAVMTPGMTFQQPGGYGGFTQQNMGYYGSGAGRW